MAVAWIVVPNVQLDVGANFGLTGATPANWTTSPFFCAYMASIIWQISSM
jgi:hypothetical protein